MKNRVSNNRTGIISNIKKVAGKAGNKRFYISVVLSERHVKFLAFEIARTSSNASNIVRFVLDDFIDRKMREDERFGRAMDMLMSNNENSTDNLKELIDNYGDGEGRRKGGGRGVELDIVKDVEIDESKIVSDDYGDEYLISVPGSGKNIVISEDIDRSDE